MRDYARERANRLYYLSRGRCPVCGGLRPVVEGGKRCEFCREHERKRKKEIRDRYRAEGRCYRCGKPLEDDKHAQCEKCRARTREISRKRPQYYKRKNAGMCVSCGTRAAEAGKVMCKRCAQRSHDYAVTYDPGWKKHKAMRDARKAAGLCIDCGRPSEGFTRCQRCRAMRLDSFRKYKIMRKIRKGKL